MGLKFILVTSIFHVCTIGFSQSQIQFPFRHVLDLTQNILIDPSINFFTTQESTLREPCKQTLNDINLGGGYPNPIVENTYNAEISITATGIVASGTHVNFEAGNIITLDPGFTVDVFAEFSASIVDCIPIMEPCEFLVDVQSNITQPNGDTSAEISFSFTDNSTILNSVTIYCFERECFTNSEIGEVFSNTIVPPQGVDMYSFVETITVGEPGQYTCILYTHNGCPGNDEFDEQIDFDVWAQQNIHPCE